MTASATKERPALPACLRDVMQERIRQQAKGYTSANDQRYTEGQLVEAAACYALSSIRQVPCGRKPGLWPWGSNSWKPSYDRGDLVKAAALLLAEIERLDAKDVPNVQKSQC